MPTRIPLPGNRGEEFRKGVDTGSSLFSRMMQPILEREKQKQLDAHFQEQLKLNKAAAGRAAQAAADAHKKMDPMYEINQYKALENWVKGQAAQQAGQGGGGQMPGAQQPPMPQQEMGEGMGMFSPQGLQEAQQAPPVTAIAAPPIANAGSGGMGGGLDLELLKAHPMLRGFAKKHLGIDPLAAVPQTPEEKQAAALDLFKQKEQIKTANKTGGGETLTAPIKTKYQNVIGGVTSARPILKKLIEETKKGKIPGQMFGQLFKRDAQANYKGEVSTLLDGIRNAYTIPNTDSGTTKAEDKVLRKNGESDANYAKRLQSILDQMDAREKDARVKLNAGNITAGAPTVHLVGPNGEDYDVPESEVNAILQEHPEVRRG